MPSRLPLMRLWIVLLAPLWVGHASVGAEPSQTLAEKRLGIIKGTSSGIVLFDFGSAAPRAAASAPAGQVQTSETKAAVAPAQEPAIGNRLFNALPPPSGKSLQSARRLDAPDQGVPLRTSRDVQPEAKR